MCRYESIRILLRISTIKGLVIKQFDVKTAFLHGELQEIVYMNQLERFTVKDDNLVCLLQKSLYGLKQTLRVWNETFTKFFAQFSITPTQKHISVYVGELMNGVVYLAIYVHDGLVMAGNTEVDENILEVISEKFEIQVSDADVLVVLQIERDEEARDIFISQEVNVNILLERFNMTDEGSARRVTQVGP